MNAQNHKMLSIFVIEAIVKKNSAIFNKDETETMEAVVTVTVDAQALN